EHQTSGGDAPGISEFHLPPRGEQAHSARTPRTREAGDHPDSRGGAGGVSPIQDGGGRGGGKTTSSPPARGRDERTPPQAPRLLNQSLSRLSPPPPLLSSPRRYSPFWSRWA